MTQDKVTVTQGDIDCANKCFDFTDEAEQAHAVNRAVPIIARHRTAAEADARKREAVLAEEIRQLQVDSEPSPYCPVCGSCGEDGCCGPERCRYPDTGLVERIEELQRAVEMLRSYGCPRCNGDCASANPPVLACPMKVAEDALRFAAHRAEGEGHA